MQSPTPTPFLFGSVKCVIAVEVFNGQTTTIFQYYKRVRLPSMQVETNASNCAIQVCRGLHSLRLMGGFYLFHIFGCLPS